MTSSYLLIRARKRPHIFLTESVQVTTIQAPYGARHRHISLESPFIGIVPPPPPPCDRNVLMQIAPRIYILMSPVTQEAIELCAAACRIDKMRIPMRRKRKRRRRRPSRRILIRNFNSAIVCSGIG